MLFRINLFKSTMFYKSLKVKLQKYEIVSTVTQIVIEYKVIKESFLLIFNGGFLCSL